jgi:hypothetical protein
MYENENHEEANIIVGMLSQGIGTDGRRKKIEEYCKCEKATY